MSVLSDPRKRATQEASLWLERLERTLRADQAAQFREWLKTPLHREVIIERCSLWHGPDIMAILEALIPEDVATSRLAPKRKRAWHALAWMLAICLVAASALMLLDGEPWASGEGRHKTERVEGHYRTPIGVRQQLQLPDGTTLTMNTASSVFVNYGAKSRMVALSRGEITFDVPPDPTRRFQLTVNGRVIEAERARLNVRRLGRDKSEITMIEGTARMLHPRAAARKTPAELRDALHYSYGEVTLEAGDGGTFGPAWQAISKLPKEEADARLAWQQDRIIFADERLEHALAEMARYAAREFVFADPSLRDVRVSGEFRTGDIDGLLRALRERPGIESRLDERGRTILTARP